MNYSFSDEFHIACTSRQYYVPFAQSRFTCAKVQNTLNSCSALTPFSFAIWFSRNYPTIVVVLLVLEIYFEECPIN